MVAPFLTSAASSLIGGLLAGRGTKRRDVTPEVPKFQRELIDQLLSGLKGQGPMADLFQASPEAFQRSVADPLLQQFQTQTAPSIQQRFISQGQGRGSPLESALARAGLDVQGQINQQFLPFQQQAQSRQQQAINQLLGFKEPAPEFETDITPFGGALLGLQGSGGISDLIQSLTGLFSQSAPENQVRSLTRDTTGRQGFLS